MLDLALTTPRDKAARQKSFADAAGANINIMASGSNEHHKIEAIFKSFAKAVKMAIRKDLNHLQLPSTKGLL